MNQSQDPKITVLVDDLFASQAQTWVNTVNTVGIMGKGVALEFKKRFPEMYRDYRLRCERGEVKIGEPYLWRPLVPPYVLNFPTKEHWRSVSRLQDIVEGLEFLASRYREWGITSLAVPPLGCGQGGLDWSIVGPTLYRGLAQLDIPVWLYAPYGTPHAELEPMYLQRSLEELRVADQPYHAPTRIASSWVALVAVIERLQQNPYRSPVGRTIFQKLAYFATAAGLPTGLDFRRQSYGPYTEGLKAVQSKLVNNGLLREAPRGKNMITYEIGPTYEAAVHTHEKELAEWLDTTDRVADLMSRMSAREAEVAATVHFVAEELATREGTPPREKEVFDAVMDWKQRRNPPLREGEVAASVRHLALLGWLQVRHSRSLPIDDLTEVGF